MSRTLRSLGAVFVAALPATEGCPEAAGDALASVLADAVGCVLADAVGGALADEEDGALACELAMAVAARGGGVGVAAPLSRAQAARASATPMEPRVLEDRFMTSLSSALWCQWPRKRQTLRARKGMLASGEQHNQEAAAVEARAAFGACSAFVATCDARCAEVGQAASCSAA